MTAQAHERLILDGEETSMMTCPGFPEKHSRVSQGFRSGDEINLITRSTACWRRYVGTWEIRDGMLFLRSVVGCYHLNGDGPVRADWYSGTLRVPRGEMIQYVHMGFGSVYEDELYIKIRRGRVVKRTLKSRRLGNVAVKSLANLPLIGEFFGEGSFLASVASWFGKVWLFFLLGILYVLFGTTDLERHVPVAVTALTWSFLSMGALIALAFVLVFGFFWVAGRIKEKRKPKPLSREEWEQHWKDWREQRAVEKELVKKAKAHSPVNRTAE